MKKNKIIEIQEEVRIPQKGWPRDYSWKEGEKTAEFTFSMKKLSQLIEKLESVDRKSLLIYHFIPKKGLNL